MLRKIRIALAALFFTGVTLLLAGLGSSQLGWMADIQFLPSVMRVIGSATLLNIALLAGLVVLTLLLGRIYCSVICPLGIWQDIINWLSSRRKGKKRRFHFKKDNPWRYVILALYIICMVAGAQVVIAILAPYSAWGRIVHSVIDPLGSGWALLTVAVLTLLATGLLAWFGGRSWCNTICPVGTTLGLFSRFALLKPVIDADKCTHCHGCEKRCKGACIDSKGQKIDYSRCVACFDCIDDCKFGAIRFGHHAKASSTGRRDVRGAEKGPFGNAPLTSAPAPATPKAEAVDKSRRAFLAGSALALGAATLRAQEQKLDGGLAKLEPKRTPERTERIVPPGARGIKEFYSRCTACQLCVSSCPNKVLRPSTDLEHLMQPEASFENGWCRPECSVCSQVCPAGAILPVTPEERSAIHVGTATVDYDLCVVNRDNVSCGNCHRHCPTGAIILVRRDPDDPHSLHIPTVDEQKCIGCGACEYLCPSRPISAIKVNGLKIHING